MQDTTQKRQLFCVEDHLMQTRNMAVGVEAMCSLCGISYTHIHLLLSDGKAKWDTAPSVASTTETAEVGSDVH